MTTLTKKDEAESVGAARGSAKHTPGPWRARLAPKGGEYYIEGPEGQSKILWLVGTAVGRDQKTDAANASLMAAAPELVWALRRVLALAEDYLAEMRVDARDSERAGYPVDADLLNEAEQDVLTARAALAKAEGRSASEGGPYGK